MAEIQEVLVEAIQSIDGTTELFYQQNVEEGYRRLDDTLRILTGAIDEIFACKASGNDIGIEEDNLISVLTEAMNAMEKKDTVLLSDILQYEVKELLETVLSTL